ncbi:MAG: phosphatase PAP2 family protein [Parcubacteria group bacterium]|jgi:undecaprenyl-diphosphatase
MFEAFIIFGAKYLIVLSGIIFLAYLLQQSGDKQKQIILFAIISLPTIYVAAKLASLVYFDPRPFVVGNFAPLIPHAADNGFPSDHTLLAGALSAVIFFFHKKIGLILLVVALVVGGARVLAGVHHAVDVVGSIGIAFFVAYLLHKSVLPIMLKSKLYTHYLR